MPSCACAGACLCLIAGTISIYSYYSNNQAKTIETPNCCGCDDVAKERVDTLPHYVVAESKGTDDSV